MGILFMQYYKNTPFTIGMGILALIMSIFVVGIVIFCIALVIDDDQYHKRRWKDHHYNNRRRK